MIWDYLFEGLIVIIGLIILCYYGAKAVMAGILQAKHNFYKQKSKEIDNDKEI